MKGKEKKRREFQSLQTPLMEGMLDSQPVYCSFYGTVFPYSLFIGQVVASIVPGHGEGEVYQ